MIATKIITQKLQNVGRNLGNKSRNLLAFCFGALLVLAFAPFHFFPVIFFALSGFFWLLEEENLKAKTSFIRGFCFGFGFFVFGIHWIAISLLVEPEKFAWLIPFALTLIPGLLACYFGFLGSLFIYLKRKFAIQQSFQKIILFALIWLVFEYLRSVLFSGFPWNLLGYAWLFNENFAQTASVFGIYGMSLFAVLVGLLPIIFCQKKIGFLDKLYTAVIVVLLGANLVFGIIHQKNDLPNEAANEEIIATKFLLVQANITQEAKWREEDRYQNLLKHIRLSAAKNKVDAVIWSETSIPFAISSQNHELLDLLANAVPKNGALISGAIRVDENMHRVWNSVFVFDQNGIKSSYDKHHLVPFGEYVPFYRFLSFLLLDEVVDQITGGGGGGFSEGEGAQTIKLPKFSFSPLICYEAVFSDEVMNKKDVADFFINLTNDAWFGSSIGPYQHLDIARMRAIEYQRPLLRIASTGISASINQFGRIIQQIPLQQEGVAEISVNKSNKTSFYLKYGNWPILLISLGLISLLIKRPKYEQLC